MRLRGFALVAILATSLQLTCNCEYVTAPSGLNVRAKKSVDAEVIEVLPYGTQIEVLKKGKKWAKLKNGFVSLEWISDDDPLENMTSLGTWHITAYTATGYPCANGQYPTAGYTIACNSLPFGTQVYIQDVGFRTVEDRGPGWLGDSWCDVYMSSYGECVQWGSQYKQVWIVEGEE